MSQIPRKAHCKFWCVDALCQFRAIPHCASLAGPSQPGCLSNSLFIPPCRTRIQALSEARVGHSRGVCGRAGPVWTLPRLRAAFPNTPCLYGAGHRVGSCWESSAGRVCSFSQSSSPQFTPARGCPSGVGDTQWEALGSPLVGFAVRDWSGEVKTQVPPVPVPAVTDPAGSRGALPLLPPELLPQPAKSRTGEHSAGPAPVTPNPPHAPLSGLREALIRTFPWETFSLIR